MIYILLASFWKRMGWLEIWNKKLRAYGSNSSPPLYAKFLAYAALVSLVTFLDKLYTSESTLNLHWWCDSKVSRLLAWVKAYIQCLECVFFKLHITARPVRVILIFRCYTYGSLTQLEISGYNLQDNSIETLSLRFLLGLPKATSSYASTLSLYSLFSPITPFPARSPLPLLSRP